MATALLAFKSTERKSDIINLRKVATIVIGKNRLVVTYTSNRKETWEGYHDDLHPVLRQHGFVQGYNEVMMTPVYCNIAQAESVSIVKTDDGADVRIVFKEDTRPGYGLCASLKMDNENVNAMNKQMVHTVNLYRQHRPM